MSSSTETGPGKSLRRDAGIIGLLFASTTSMIGSGWLFGALHASKIAGPLSMVLISVLRPFFWKKPPPSAKYASAVPSNGRPAMRNGPAARRRAGATTAPVSEAESAASIERRECLGFTCTCYYTRRRRPLYAGFAYKNWTFRARSASRRGEQNAPPSELERYGTCELDVRVRSVRPHATLV